MVVFALVAFTISVAPCVASDRESGLSVVDLAYASPVVVGHYVTLSCTVKNNGESDAHLGGLRLNISKDGSSFFPVSLWPFTNAKVPVALHAGATYSFKMFQRISQPGTYRVDVSVGSAGAAAVLDSPDNALTELTFEAKDESETSTVRYQVSDPTPDHVYRPGNSIAITVLPVVVGGPDLSSFISNVALNTPVKPFSSPNVAEAKSRLFEPRPAAKSDMIVDFWGVPDASKYVDLDVTMKAPTKMASFTVSGRNLNGQYGLAACEVQGAGPDGTTFDIPTIATTVGSAWDVISASSQPFVISSLRVRLHTAYKIDVTGASLVGVSHAAAYDDAPVPVSCEWEDVDGHALSPSRSLSLYKPTVVESPSGVAPGYYALVMTSRIPGQDELTKVFGFAVLADKLGDVATSPKDARFGMVHPDMNDACLHDGWIKTMATYSYNGETQALDGDAWNRDIAARQKLGFTEMPLVSGRVWDSDSTKPISSEQLARIRTMMEQYFRATPPEIADWELGLEENLGYRANKAAWTCYWPNLAAKVKAVRQAADACHRKVALAYQIAEDDLPAVDAFLSSDASREFDILSLHPYWWPSFPTPETWMPAYIAHVHALMAKYNRPLPIWFTEIGAPVNANPGGFLGYPGDPGHFDRALSRSDHAKFAVKCNLLALKLGVVKVFWYNDRDGGANPEYAEDNFGMVDYWGYPKPTYVAYATMTDLLCGRDLASSTIVDGDIYVMRFTGADKDVVALWANSKTARTVRLHDILPIGRASAVFDLYGTPERANASALTVTDAPSYVVIDHTNSGRIESSRRSTERASSVPRKKTIRGV
jgi:hypothetical protein